MQVSDMLNQYNQNTATGATAVAPRQGVQQLVAAVREMTVGNVFEGTVNQMKHGQVTLGLVNGQTIHARVAGNVKLTVGQSMFFQVKANDGNTVEIRPYTNGNLDNPTLLKALDAAGVPAAEHTIEMVNAMMEEQMPIDRSSIQTMAKNIAGFEQENMKDLVQMAKLDIPITRENVVQFFNYKQDQAAITREFENVLQGLQEVYQDENLGGKQLAAISNRVWQVIQGEDIPVTAESMKEYMESGWSPAEFSQMVGASYGEESMPSMRETTERSEIPWEQTGEIAWEQTEQTASGEAFPIPEKNVVSIDQSVIGTPGQETPEYPPHTLGAVLSEADTQKFAEMIEKLDWPRESLEPIVTEEGQINPKLTVSESVDQLNRIFTQFVGEEHTGELRNILTSRQYRNMVRDVLEQQWTIKPDEVRKDTVKRLYENLEHQLKQMEQIVKDSGQQNTPLAKAVNQLQGNLEFMSQINQSYQFVQIPLQMSGQPAQSELYVYTNKKNLADPDGELSAFLHLDMEHLGSTDVSVRMKNKQVRTDFYMEDDRSYALVEAHAEELTRRLEKMGYQCGISVEAREHKMDFVEDFLKKDQPAGGVLHRYSFDVRA
ncbi:MAG: flagellar hook-length control protein FliK [Lachnospiraceae bacterium]|nr:flagellar hook-length control protein FliK [Lachnospiraceae bacterium]